MQITIEAICKEFDIRPEEVFAFMDEENINLGGNFMHDIKIDMVDFRKFVEYWRRELKSKVEQTERDLANLDNQVNNFLNSQRGW